MNPLRFAPLCLLLIGCEDTEPSTPAPPETQDSAQELDSERVETFTQERQKLDVVLSLTFFNGSVPAIQNETTLLKDFGNMLNHAGVDLHLVAVDACQKRVRRDRLLGQGANSLITREVAGGLGNALQGTLAGLIHTAHHSGNYTETLDSVVAEYEKLENNDDFTFRRPDADFAVVAFSNSEEDSNEYNAKQFGQWIVEQGNEGYDARFVAMAPISSSCSFIDPLTYTGLYSDVALQVLEEAPGIARNWCLADRRDELEDMVADLVSSTASYELDFQAAPGSIEVDVEITLSNGQTNQYRMEWNSQESSRRFEYNHAKRTVTFPYHRPPAGAKIEITYEPETSSSTGDTGLPE